MEDRKTAKNLKWAKFAFGEGLAKATNKSISKSLGIYIRNVFASERIVSSFFFTLIIGFVQMAGGLIIALAKKQRLYNSSRQIKGSIGFGLIATAMTFLAVYTFTFPGADLAVTTFLITLSIIPSRLIDRIFYKEKLRWRQYAGLAGYVLVAYIFLRDFMDTSSILAMPPWAWIALLSGLLLSINNLIARKIKETDGFVHNFWAGATTLVASIFVISFFGGWDLVGLVKVNLWAVAAIMGLVTLFMITMKLLAFKTGATLTFEVFVQQSTYLIFVTIFGIIFFHEPLTTGKIIGFPGFIIAFTLANQEIWEFVVGKLGLK